MNRAQGWRRNPTGTEAEISREDTVANRPVSSGESARRPQGWSPDRCAGRRRGPAEGRPAGVGGGRPDPRGGGRAHSPIGASGQHGGQRRGGPGTPCLTAPPHPAPLLTCGFPRRRDSYQPHPAAASNYCRKSPASRRGAPLDAPPWGPVDWPVRSHVTVVLLPELGGLGARVRSERKPHPPILGARGPIVVPSDSPCWRCPGRLAETIWLATVSGRPLRTYRPPRRRAAASKDTRWYTLTPLTSLSHFPALPAGQLWMQRPGLGCPKTRPCLPACRALGLKEGLADLPPRIAFNS